MQTNFLQINCAKEIENDAEREKTNMRKFRENFSSFFFFRKTKAKDAGLVESSRILPCQECTRETNLIKNNSQIIIFLFDSFEKKSLQGNPENNGMRRRHYNQ